MLKIFAQGGARAASLLGSRVNLVPLGSRVSLVSHSGPSYSPYSFSYSHFSSSLSTARSLSSAGAVPLGIGGATQQPLLLESLGELDGGDAGGAERIIAHGKNTKVRHSKKKLEDACRRVKGMRVPDAVRQLRFDPTKAGAAVLTAVKRARAQAVHLHGLDGGTLVLDTLRVNVEKRLRIMKWGGRSSRRPQTSTVCRVLVTVRDGRRDPVKEGPAESRYALKHARDFSAFGGKYGKHGKHGKYPNGRPAGSASRQPSSARTRSLDIRLRPDGSVAVAAKPVNGGGGKMIGE